jgi:preprotein translocase subunit YajC
MCAEAEPPRNTRSSPVEQQMHFVEGKRVLTNFGVVGHVIRVRPDGFVEIAQDLERRVGVFLIPSAAIRFLYAGGTHDA